MKNILYLLLFLFPVLGHSQIFVAEFDNIVSGTPSVGTYSAIGVFSDNDGYGQTTDSISVSGIHYFIDAGGQEYVIVAKSGSSPLTIEFNPVNGAGSPELGIGQLTSKTNNQYHMTAAVGDLTRTKILNLNIQAGSTGSGVDSASYASDTLYLFLEGTTVAKTKVSPAITTFNLNGTTLELELANGGQSTVDLAAVGGITAPPILGQASEPTSDRFFWKDTDGDTSRVKAPFGNQGYKDLAYYDDIMSITTNTYQGKAILDTIPLLAGIDQARLDSMHLIGITHNTVTVNAATAARDTLYPDGFVISIYGGDSMIVAYSGIIEFPDSVFSKGKNYYQPYEYKKYQESPDSIVEQLAFKALDTNIIEIRDRYSYLAENRLQSERGIPTFYDVPPFTDNIILYHLQNEGITITGSGISEWDNVYGDNSTQTSDPLRPTLGGQGQAVFTDAQYLNSANSIFEINDTARTFIFVLNTPTTGTQERFAGTASFSRSSYHFLFTDDNGVNRRYHLFYGHTLGNKQISTSYSYPLNDDTTVSFRFRENCCSDIRVNGVSGASETDGNNFNYSGSTFGSKIGADPNNSNNWRGEIKGLIIYNKRLSDSEIQQAEDYLNSKT